MNTDNRLLTRESSEHIREFFSTVERLSVSMERLFAGRSPAMAGENFYTDRELAEKLKVSAAACNSTVTAACLHLPGWAARYCTVLPISRSCLTAATGRREPGRRNFRNVPYGIVNKGAVGCHTGRPFVSFHRMNDFNLLIKYLYTEYFSL